MRARGNVVRSKRPRAVLSEEVRDRGLRSRVCLRRCTGLPPFAQVEDGYDMLISLINELLIPASIHQPSDGSENFGFGTLALNASWLQ